jgi:hypothetical protein
MKRLQQWWVGRHTNTRNFQHELDLYCALILASYRNRATAPLTTTPSTSSNGTSQLTSSPETLEQTFSLLSQVTQDIQRTHKHQRSRLLHDELTVQVTAMMDELQRTGGFNPYPVCDQ